MNDKRNRLLIVLCILAGFAFVSSLTMKAWVLFCAPDSLKEHWITARMNPIFIAILTIVAVLIVWKKHNRVYVFDNKARWFILIVCLIDLFFVSLLVLGVL